MTPKTILTRAWTLFWSFRGVTSVVLAALLIGYVGRFVAVYYSYLFDKNLQNDDARIVLFPFWSFSHNPDLAKDPMVQEQLGVIMASFQLLYRFILLFTDVLMASKVVQLACFSMVLWGGYVLWRSRRAGLASAVLFVAFFLATPFFLNRIGGGLPRGFAFPCIALWAAGAIAAREKVRWVAMVIGGLFYPPAMVLTLGAEGVFALRGLRRMKRGLFLRRSKKYAQAILICSVFFVPNYLMNDRSERMHTYEEAIKNPAFRKGGRLVKKEQVPFTDPAPIWGRTVTRFFQPSGAALLPDAQAWVKNHHASFGLLSLALCAFLALIGLTRFPVVGSSILISSIVCYCLSRVLAFLLYTPLRYLEFGTLAGVFVMSVEILGFFLYGTRLRHRVAIRNLAATGVLCFMVLVMGTGFRAKTGMTIDYSKRADLWEAIDALPGDSRLLAHPHDANSIGLFGKRGATISQELLVPWYVDRWKRHQERVKDVFGALYATDQKEFLRICKKHEITHVLKAGSRYRRDFLNKLNLFNPLTRQVQSMLRGRKLNDLLLTRVPEEAIVGKHRYELISVAKLEAAWAEAAKAKAKEEAERAKAKEEAERAKAKEDTLHDPVIISDPKTQNRQPKAVKKAVPIQ
jgi:hypothetical protein